MAGDYYKVLGVSRDASPEEIKKAYHKLAHKYHPDKGGDEKRFKELSEAYQILSNQEKRKTYDTYGSNAFKGAGFGAGTQGGWPFGQGGFGQGGFNMNFGGEDVGDIKDIFDIFFDGMGGTTRRRKTYKRGGDLELIAEITLEEAKAGKIIETSFDTFLKCKTCEGVGHDASAGFDTCSHCAGRGEVKEDRFTFFGNFSQVVPCKKCLGNGQIPKKTCSHCKGSGRIKGSKSVKFEIRPGIEDGQIIKLVGQGESGEYAQEPGDLYVRVKVKPHSVFVRRGNDVYATVPASITDILLARKKTMKGLGGGTVTYNIPAGFDLRDEIRVKGEGMTRSGDLVIQLDARSPKHLSSKAKKLIEDLEKEI